MIMSFFNFFKKTQPKDSSRTSPKEALTTLQDLIAPAGLEISPNNLKLGEKYCSTLFVLTYPRYLSSNWFSSLVNLDESFDISIFFHPLEVNAILRDFARNLLRCKPRFRLKLKGD